MFEFYQASNIVDVGKGKLHMPEPQQATSAICVRACDVDRAYYDPRFVVCESGCVRVQGCITGFRKADAERGDAGHCGRPFRT